MTFETRWLNGSAADVLEGIFAPDHLVMLSGSTAGIPVVSNFREISPRFEQFQNICVNPVVSPRFRVPTKRQSIVISLPGNTLVAQFAKALYLRQIIPLELAVFVPAKMTTEFWFQSGTAASLNPCSRRPFARPQ